MKITEATRLKDLLEEYPWLKDEDSKGKREVRDA